MLSNPDFEYTEPRLNEIKSVLEVNLTGLKIAVRPTAEQNSGLTYLIVSGFPYCDTDQQRVILCQAQRDASSDRKFNNIYLK